MIYINGVNYYIALVFIATEKEVQLPTQDIVDVSKTTVTESHLTTLEIPIKFTKPLTTEMYAKPKEQAMYVLVIQYVVL